MAAKLTRNQKNCHFEASSFYIQQHWTISRWDCDMHWKMDLYNNWQRPAQWLDWEKAAKHFSKPNLHQKKVMVPGGLLPVWSTTAFWMLSKPLHLRSMLSKSMRCTRNSYACSWHWSTERAQFFSTAIPDGRPHNQHFKSWTNWATEFCLIHRIHLFKAQSCPTLSDPKDCSSPGSSVHGILQARILERVAISFSRASSWPRDWTPVSCIAERLLTIWATREGHIHLTSRQLTTFSSISTTFCRENASTTLRMEKNAFPEFVDPETRIFTLQE